MDGMTLLGLVIQGAERTDSPALTQAGKFLDALSEDCRQGGAAGTEFKATLEALCNLRDPVWKDVGMTERMAISPMLKLFARGFGK